MIQDKLEDPNINKETAKQFLEVNGYPNIDSNFENELLDTMVEYAISQVKNNDLSHNNAYQIKQLVCVSCGVEPEIRDEIICSNCVIDYKSKDCGVRNY